MRSIADIGAAVIGTGFIGTVHVEALRRIGVQVRGVLGSSPERGAGAGRGARRQAGLRLTGRPAGGRHRGRRPRHLPQRPAREPEPRDPRGRQACRLREAARDDRPRIGGARPPRRVERPRERDEFQHPLLPPQPARARAHRGRRPGRGAPRDRTLFPGLAAPRERLELAAAARPRRRPARGRRHRIALARPHDLRDRPARERGHGRPVDLHRHASRAHRSGRDVLDGSLRGDRWSARSRPRTRRPSCSASMAAPGAR